MDTEWGRVLTSGLKELVELKKTRRLQDYPIISRLTLAWFDQPECAGAEPDYRWALENLFTLPEPGLFCFPRPRSQNREGSD